MRLICCHDRLYALEPTPTITGAPADHRLVVKASEVIQVARAIADALKIKGVPYDATSLSSSHFVWISALVRDLQAHRGRCVVVAGDPQPPEVHVLAHAINESLGNTGKTVAFHPPAEQGPASQTGSLADLARDIRQGHVDALLILGANPVYDAPADLDFQAALTDEKLRLRIHLGLYQDETAELCQWHVPEAHFLEAWSDVRLCDGTVTIQQPLIAPLYHGRSAHEAGRDTAG